MKPRGSTLLELIVVGGIFVGMLTALWAIYDTTVRVQQSVSLKVDVDREVFAAVRHVDWSLKTARLVSPADWYSSNPQAVQTLQLIPLSLGSNGQPQITPQGFPQFGTPYAISFQNGQLVRVTDYTRVLATLGQGGSCQFLRKSQGMLEMDLNVTQTGFRGETTARQLSFQLRLFNQ